jgi:hypothetical protein
MSFFDTEFDANTVEIKDRNYQPIPAGWYECAIHSAEAKGTKNNGEMLSVRFDVVGPTHQGAVVFGNITLRSENSEAVRIGLEQLAKIALAVGETRIRSPEQLAGKKLKVKFGIKPGNEQYPDPSNKVVDFAKSESGIPSTIPRTAPVRAKPAANGPPAWAARGK